MIYGFSAIVGVAAIFVAGVAPELLQCEGGAFWHPTKRKFHTPLCHWPPTDEFRFVHYCYDPLYMSPVTVTSAIYPPLA